MQTNILFFPVKIINIISHHFRAAPVINRLTTMNFDHNSFCQLIMNSCIYCFNSKNCVQLEKTACTKDIFNDNYLTDTIK
jgi:hypothetical protein